MGDKKNKVDVTIAGKDETSSVIKRIEGRFKSFASSAKGHIVGAFSVEAAKKVAEFFGNVLSRSATGQKAIAAVGGAWEKVTASLSSALTGSEGFRTLTDVLTTKLEGLARWIQRNSRDIGEFAGGLTGVVTAIAKASGWIGDVLVSAFRGGQVAIVAIAVEFEKLPHRMRYVAGAVLNVLGDLVEKGGILLNLFGVQAGDELADTLHNAATRMQADATRQLGYLRNAARETIDEIRAVKAETDDLPAKPGGAPQVGLTPKFVKITAGPLQPQVVTMPPIQVESPEVEINLTEFESQLAQLQDGLASRLETVGFDVAGTLGAAMSAGFAHNLEDAKDVALQGLGGILTSMGEAMVSTGLAVKGLLPALTNPITSGPALVATGALLIGLGATLSNIAKHGPGGSKSGRGGAAASGLGVARTDSALGQMNGAGTTVIITFPKGSVFNPHDPEQRREFARMNKAVKDLRITESGS